MTQLTGAVPVADGRVPRRRKVTRLPGVLRTALALVRDASRTLAWAVLAVQVAVAGLAVAQLAALRAALDAIVTGGDTGDYTPVTLPLGVLAALVTLAGVLAAVLQQSRRLLAHRVTRLVRDRVFEVTTDVDLEQFERPEFFDRLQRVMGEAADRPLQLTQGLVDLVASALTTVAVGTALFLIDPLLVPVLLLPAVPLVVLSRRASRLEFEFARAQGAGHLERAYYADVLTGRDGAKEVRAFGLAGALRARNAASLDRHEAALRDLLRSRVALAVVSSLLGSAALVLSIVVVVLLLRSGRLGIADAGVAAIAVRLLGTRVENTFKAAGALLESALFLDELQQFMRLAVERRRARDAAVVRRELPRVAHLQVVSAAFRYPGSTEDAVRDVDIDLRAGEVVALVGENGSGKTTLAKLVAGLYTPTRGQVLWNGVDVETCSGDQRRDQTAVVFQDFVRYGLPARDNIVFGRPDAPVDERAVTAAAEGVGLHDVLQALPLGYDTPLSRLYEGGRDLSVGQWQRLALARAMYRDAPLLVLDEPSASMDARSEQALFERVRELMADRAVLLVSHRFATVRTADRIYVLHEGQVVEQGSHQELLSLGGRYAELYELQARSFREPA